MGAGFVWRVRVGIGLAVLAVTFACIVGPAETVSADSTGKQRLERSLKKALRKEDLTPTRVWGCKQRGSTSSCRWRAEGLFPGEVPYRCSGKARLRAGKGGWKIGECVNQLEPMVPLMPEPGPHPVFGFNEEWLLPPNRSWINYLPGIGADAARLAVQWQNVEGTPGQYGWNLYDPVYQHMVDRGIRPLLVLIGSPCWAQASPCEGLDHPAPQHYSDFAAFAARAAQRYGDAIGIELWNEPNSAKFWGGPPDPAAYAALVQETAPAIQAANPHVPVVTGGLVPYRAADDKGIPPLDFLRQAFAAGGLQSADAIGAHPYPFRGYGEDFQGAIRIELARYLQAMDEFGSRKPIWVTEVGVAEAQGYTPYEQADALVRIYVMLRRVADVPVVIFHRFVDQGADPVESTYGIVEADGTLKPGYCAIAAARENPC